MMKWLFGDPTAAVLLTLVACLVSVSGCQKSTRGSATVSGRVLYDNVPVRMGMVVFHTDVGRIGQSAIQPGGNYRITALPEGEVKICVNAKDYDLTMKKRLARQRGEKVENPAPTETSQLMDKLTAKYSNVETTPLMLTIQGGQQQHDIVLSLP